MYWSSIVILHYYLLNQDEKKCIKKARQVFNMQTRWMFSVLCRLQ